MSWPLKPLLAALLMGVLGCPKRPLEFGPEGPIVDAAELLRRVDAADDALKSVQGDGKLGMDSPRGKGTASAYLAVRRPADVHLELLSFFGRPEAFFVTTETWFSLYQVEQAKFYEGPASARNLELLIPARLSAAELASLMLGSVPRIVSDAPELEVDDQARAYALTLRNGQSVQRLWVDTVLFRVRKSILEQPGGYTAEFDDFERLGYSALPRELKVHFPHERSTVTLRYTDVQANAPIEDELFQLAAPDGVERIRMGEAP